MHEKTKTGTLELECALVCCILIKTNQNRQKRELDILRTFKENNINSTDKITYREKSKLHKNLEQFKGIELDKNFGIYEISFISDLTIKSVTEISGFENPIDQKLIKIIEQTEWTSNDNGINDKVPDNSKLIIGIYYYSEEKGKSEFFKSILSLK